MSKALNYCNDFLVSYMRKHFQESLPSTFKFLSKALNFRNDSSVYYDLEHFQATLHSSENIFDEQLMLLTKIECQMHTATISMLIVRRSNNEVWGINKTPPLDTILCLCTPCLFRSDTFSSIP